MNLKNQDRECRGICSNKNKLLDSKPTLFRKYCNICNTFLISKYFTCPCCHAKLDSANKD